MCDTGRMRRRRLDDLLERLREHAGLDVAFGGLVDDRADGFVIDCVQGDGMRPIANLAIDPGTGAGGKSLVTGRPVRVADYRAAGAITHHYDRPVVEAGLRSVFAMPVGTGRRPYAMVYGALRSPVPISDRRLAIANTLLKRYEHELRVHDEVARTIDELDAAASAGRMREQLREIYAESMAIAEQISDPALRQRIEALRDRARAGAAGDRVPAGPAADAASLSRRELDTVAQAAAGLSNAEIAERLGLMPSTVKAYLRSAMRKAGVHNRLALVIACRRGGMIP